MVYAHLPEDALFDAAHCVSRRLPDMYYCTELELDRDLDMCMQGTRQNGPGKKNRGSRPRCIELLSGTEEDVASNLTSLVSLEQVTVVKDDFWEDEARIECSSGLIPCDTTRTEIRNWWLAVPHPRANTPNWDLASTCMIEGRKGLLLVEAKAHSKELTTTGKPQRSSSANSKKNHSKIGTAIMEANADLERLTGRTWRLSRDNRYQLSNRFAWSWKLASLKIPVVLVYLGFLNACDMVHDGELFETEHDWSQAVLSHASGLVDKSIWGVRINVNGTPFWPLIRAMEVSI